MIPKATIGLAAEYAVASELARRGMYAQLTLGNVKRTDLLIFSGDGAPIRIEVKAKQGCEWPHCKGIAGSNTLMVLVDFRGKADSDRPDFYVLSVEDWLRYARSVVVTLPEKRIFLDSQNTPVWPTEVKNGKPYRGMSIDAESVAAHKEAWGKITARVLEAPVAAS